MTLDCKTLVSKFSKCKRNRIINIIIEKDLNMTEHEKF